MKTANKHRRLRGVACKARCSLDIFSSVFQSPEGRKQNSPGLQPWESDAQRNRPERASESSRLRRRPSLETTPGSRPPFQGASLSVRIPRAEALGCSVFALRAIQNFESPWGVVCNARAPGYKYFALPGLKVGQFRRSALFLMLTRIPAHAG